MASDRFVNFSEADIKSFSEKQENANTKNKTSYNLKVFKEFLASEELVIVEEQLNSLFLWATMDCNTIVLTGDLNLDRLKPEQREGRLLRNLEEVYELECLITEPTRVTNTSSTLLDVILTNKPQLFKRSGILNPEISDHYLTFALMESKISKHRKKVITFRSMKSLDVEMFNEELTNAPWWVMNIFDTMEDKWNYWKALSLFNSILETHTPMRKMRVRQVDVPYMTMEWKQAIRRKRKYAKKYARNKTNENWELKKKWRNEATKCRRRAIKKFWKEKADHLNSKPYDFYNIFRPFLSDKRQKGSDINIRKVDGKVEKDPRNVSNIMVNYFATMADAIGGVGASMLNENDLSEHSSIGSIKTGIYEQEGPIFHFRKIKSAQIKSALEKLNTRKACGWDSITPKMLKLASTGIADSLTMLFNTSIDSGIWPDAWKKGEWCPVFKNEDPLNEMNYRPVTLLSTVDKVYEQLLSGQVYQHFDNILDSSISAYRKMHSCETTIIRLTEEWKSAMDNKQVVGILSTDMSKAFDSLQPSLLINKLKAYGFSEQALCLMRSYFTNKQNRVKLNSVVSEWKDMRRGCPQGSSFGPLLWNIFQNDLTYQITDANISMYADDHQIYVIAESISQVEQTLRNEGVVISRWYNENYLKGNHKKYGAMILCNRDTEAAAINITIDGENVESKLSLKLLGVTLDSRLNYSSHISDICKKAGSKVGVLNRLKKLVPTHALLQLYKAGVLPNLTYCHMVWHFCRASDTKKLERVQERALRAVFSNKTATYEQLLEWAKLPSLENRRLQDILILMYKVKHNLVPKTIIDIFPISNSKYNLRNKDFSIPRVNTTKYGKHSIRYLGPYLWSKININLRQKTSLEAFKHAIRGMDIKGLLDGSCNCQVCQS